MIPSFFFLVVYFSVVFFGFFPDSYFFAYGAEMSFNNTKGKAKENLSTLYNFLAAYASLA